MKETATQRKKRLIRKRCKKLEKLKYETVENKRIRLEIKRTKQIQYRKKQDKNLLLEFRRKNYAIQLQHKDISYHERQFENSINVFANSICANAIFAQKSVFPDKLASIL